MCANESVGRRDECVSYKGHKETIQSHLNWKIACDVKTMVIRFCLIFVWSLVFSLKNRRAVADTFVFFTKCTKYVVSFMFFCLALLIQLVNCYRWIKLSAFKLGLCILGVMWLLLNWFCTMAVTKKFLLMTLRCSYLFLIFSAHVIVSVTLFFYKVIGSRKPILIKQLTDVLALHLVGLTSAFLKKAEPIQSGQTGNDSSC